MSILNVISIPKPQFLSFSRSTTTFNPDTLLLASNLSQLSLHSTIHRKQTIIRMGGGPRTFPGGVNKWQWKRMQAKKATQLLKARLCRERQIYEMRKRAELKAAVAELEKPWEVVERAPTLFSVKADEQLKVLADRFQRPGGFDMWSDKDGPQLFDPVGDDLPSSRFFPRGVVHSVKPYQPLLGSDDNVGFDDNDDELFMSNSGSKVERMAAQRKVHANNRANSISSNNDDDEMTIMNSDSQLEKINAMSNAYMKRRRNSMRRFRSGPVSNIEIDRKRLPSKEGGSAIEASNMKNSMGSSNVKVKGGNGKGYGDRIRKNGNMRSSSANSEQRRDNSITGLRHGRSRRDGGSVKVKNSSSEIFDMSLHRDGSYGS